MRAHRKHRSHAKYQGDPQKASKKNYCGNSECDMPKGFRIPETNLCCRYRPCEKVMSIFKVELTPSYEVKDGLWVEVDGVYHICKLEKEKLSESTLCGIQKVGYGREWAYRLVAGSMVCGICAEKGIFTNNPEMNMQNFELVLKKK